MTKPALLVFSHLRWNFVYQRPQHLLARHAKVRRVIYFEEPIFDARVPELKRVTSPEGVEIITPHLSENMNADARRRQLAQMAEDVAAELKPDYTVWYYTPMALSFTANLKPRTVIYDCMDELSAFKRAPAELRELENDLLNRADLVFTGGRSLYEAKKSRHPSVHLFASSIETEHFGKAKQALPEPADQRGIAHPRLGFYGVIDERMDLDLLAGAAKARPDWNFVMIGPVVKIDPASLPRAKNIFWLGMKTYPELPDYLAGWDVALLPFALNESTEFISPTKTLEYLAAGKPIVSTAIRDVVEPFLNLRLVRISRDAQSFVSECEAALKEGLNAERVARGDRYLSNTSWDKTFQQMLNLEARVWESTSPAKPAFGFVEVAHT